jgi:ABC-type glycerol-3-phosphate transport system substrate-binding protein
VNGYNEPFKANNPDGELVYADVPKGPTYREDINFSALSPRGWVRNGVYAGTKELDAVMRVIDWFSSEEGQMTNFFGIEGQHYTVDADGVVKRLVNDDGLKELGLTECYIVTDWLETANSKPLQEATAFGASLATYNKNDGLVVEEKTLYEADLEEYVSNQMLRIILGDVPVDAGFDELLAEWDKRGGKELTAAYNKAYKAKKK